MSAPVARTRVGLRWPSVGVATAAVLLVGGVVAAALAPWLLVNAPLVLVGLAPDTRHLVLVIGSVPTPVLLTVAVARRVLFCAASFGVGVQFGDRAVALLDQRVPRLARLVRLLESWVARFGAWIVLVLPFPTTCVLVGASGVRFGRFLIAATIGHTLWVSGILFLGGLIVEFTRPVVAFISAHTLKATLVCVCLVVLSQLWSRRRKRSKVPTS